MVAMPGKIQPLVPTPNLLDMLAIEAMRAADREADTMGNYGSPGTQLTQQRYARAIFDVPFRGPRTIVSPKNIGDNFDKVELITGRFDEPAKRRLIRQPHT